MISRLVALALLSIALTACAPVRRLTVRPSEAFLIAQEAQAGCLGTTLELFRELADRLAPLAEARDLPSLEAKAIAAGCLFTPGNPGYLFCPGLVLRGESFILSLRVDFLAGGIPVADPSYADGLRLAVEGAGAQLECEGLLTVSRTEEGGVTLGGTLTAITRDGCLLTATAREIAGNFVADLPGLPSGFLFSQGRSKSTSSASAPPK
ncbi:MAG: hypothetical protein HC813_03025 [Planctomycetes bacterium]|nr:hypothetical protein [Planctomycetota bacterium]